MRQIVLDTETTGLDPAQGHRVIEIGCVELEDRKLTGNRFQCYLNPDREIDAAAIEVHGITPQFLADKPRFAQIEKEFLEFVNGAELVIHNAPFDLGFLNHELRKSALQDKSMGDMCSVLDSLLLAREKHPGQRNSLDALCKRYDVDNTQRQLHGALLDAEILADVYLAMTSGQTSMLLHEEHNEESISRRRAKSSSDDRPSLVVKKATDEELLAHKERLKEISEESEQGCLWLNLENPQ
ncbi:MAG: DNA polymerase III subunit epsilon [Gammaproteobacteria bacterium]|nr:DNA polymerase III subunit epsilon [Gammaproteobacteria bacterium]MBT3860679.1 DNA polymerase III subunit epsilon [Gammaproteobacteria bacterium]MBT3988339.1 DNA polymerase III subunit epsilon [Gammaproteobacteria bacterium]MBT4256388.1 DNA polymerase III subunit epsilon [Gammaproteobacteria bacterium]MBT4581969.1 DNA polymerase III subunit epsilon [Gammaproteobacteria bacterium]